MASDFLAFAQSIRIQLGSFANWVDMSQERVTDIARWSDTSVCACARSTIYPDKKNVRTVNAVRNEKMANYGNFLWGDVHAIITYSSRNNNKQKLNILWVTQFLKKKQRASYG